MARSHGCKSCASNTEIYGHALARTACEEEVESFAARVMLAEVVGRGDVD